MGSTEETRYYPERPATVKAAAIILYTSAALLVLAVCALNVVAADSGRDADEVAGLVLLVSVFFVGAAVLNTVLGSGEYFRRND